MKKKKVMETLMTEYASDTSDDDSATVEQQSEHDAQSITTTSSTKHLGHEEGTETAGIEVSCDKSASGEVEEEPTVDFFGLSNVDSDYEEVKSETESNRVESVRVQGQVIPVEIPQSDFWTDIENSELQSLQHRKFKKRTESVQLSNLRKRTLPNLGPKNSVGSSEKFKQIGTDKTPEINSGNNCFIESTAKSHQTQTRKLYFIHPKITPLLHNKRQTCRVPSRLEWKCQGHAGAVNRVKWNIPSYSHLFVTCSMDSMIKIWNIWSQLEPCVKILRNHDRAVRDVDWSQDGKKLLSCSYDKTAAVIDVEKGNSVSKFDHTSFVSCGKWQPTNPSICVTGGHNQLLAWDTRTPDIPVRNYEYKDNFGQVQDILFLSDGSTFFSSADLVSRDSADRNLMAWDFATGVTLSNQVYQERYTISRLKLHPGDGNFLAQSNGNYIAIFSTTAPYKMNRQKRFEGHKLLGYSLGFDITPDGSTVLSGSSDRKIYCYNYQTGKQFRTIQTDMDVIMDVSFHSLLSSTLVCCAWDGSVQVWK